MSSTGGGRRGEAKADGSGQKGWGERRGENGESKAREKMEQCRKCNCKVDRKSEDRWEGVRRLWNNNW